MKMQQDCSDTENMELDQNNNNNNKDNDNQNNLNKFLELFGEESPRGSIFMSDSITDCQTQISFTQMDSILTKNQETQSVTYLAEMMGTTTEDTDKLNETHTHTSNQNYSTISYQNLNSTISSPYLNKKLSRLSNNHSKISFISNKFSTISTTLLNENFDMEQED